MNFKFIQIVSIWAIFPISVVCQQPERLSNWTWLHTKRFTQQELALNRSRDNLIFSKQNIPFFSQLLFSWNGFRNCEGFFSFWVQARDASNGTWGKWHKMIDWGSDIQQSYFSKGCSKTQYHHVRLEMNAGLLSDAFRIKISPQQGADLSLIKGFSVSLSNFAKFEAESVSSYITHLPSILISGVARLSQFVLDHEDNHVLCSPTSCSMVTNFITGEFVDPVQFAQGVYDMGLATYGSWPFNTAHAFEMSDGAAWFSTVRLTSFLSLYKQLKQGRPVIVSVRGSLEGAPKPYASGHLLVVVGWNEKKKQVICHDPAAESNQKTLKRYSLKSFLHAWERSRRLAYITEPVA